MQTHLSRFAAEAQDAKLVMSADGETFFLLAVSEAEARAAYLSARGYRPVGVVGMLPGGLIAGVSDATEGGAAALTEEAIKIYAVEHERAVFEALALSPMN
jgi:hypothetical protein